jgi:ParB-like chromosome segregation protein Spo0J
VIADHLTVRRVALATLREDPGNVRRHSAKNRAAIRDSLRAFGQVEPLVVQAGSGLVIGGNGRLSVMRDLGWEECDVVEIAADDTTCARIAIALNRTGEIAEWDTEALGQLLTTLSHVDQLDGTGFSHTDLDEILNSIKDERDAVTDALDSGSMVGAVTFRLIVEGLTEASQGALLERLEAEGYQCRVSMS